MSATNALKYVPAPLVAWAFIVLVIVFVVFAGIAIFAWTQDESITLFDMDFGKTKPGLEGSTAALPSSAVVAFDLPNGCPDGWTEFADAAGRTIIGQGSGMDDGNGKPLTGRKYRGHGGEEKVKLTVAEMPTHGHSGVTAVGSYNAAHLATQDSQNLPQARGSIGASGSSKPHNNMPPYIALYFCKKD